MSDLNLNNLVDGLDTLGTVFAGLQQKSPTPPTPPTQVKVSTDPLLEYVKKVKYHWLYEARKGDWWHYDRDSNELLESTYVMGEPNIELLIDGKHKVIVHIDKMVQVTGSGSRNVERVDHLNDTKIKGIAGKYYNTQLMRTD